MPFRADGDVVSAAAVGSRAGLTRSPEIDKDSILIREGA